MTACTAHDLSYLRSTQAVRERCANITGAVRAGSSPHWRVNSSALLGTARLVAQVTRARFPDGRIPYHSRWRHFEAGDIDRIARFKQNKYAVVSSAWVKCAIDLIVTSVLLDAGAGPDWRYLENDKTYTRSEGLGVASLHAFTCGLFSSDAANPWQADASALALVTEDKLQSAFQVSDANPLVGLAGRAELLKRLGSALVARPEWFGASHVGGQRPSGLFDVLTDNGAKTSIAAHDILCALLDALGSIWPQGNSHAGVLLGDCWKHPLAGGSDVTAGWVPFHKLSQWMTYSLIEAFEQGGITVTGLDDLTALPEYRNGGLLIDSGVILPLNPALLSAPLQVHDTAVIEWRALTVSLIDELAPLVRDELGMPDLALANILEGGTWAAGRQLAQSARGGLPPLNIVTDGTVF